VSKIYGAPTQKVEMRASSSTLIPYVEIKLARADNTLPIHCLTVGPTIDPARAVHAAHVLLEVKKKNFIKVSEVPYRFW
jgi:hypothetical protein